MHASPGFRSSQLAKFHNIFPLLEEQFREGEGGGGLRARQASWDSCNVLIQSKPLYIREMYVEIDKKCFTKPIGYIINNNCWLLIAD